MKPPTLSGEWWTPRAAAVLRTYGRDILSVTKATQVDRYGISYRVEVYCCAQLGLAGDLIVWSQRVPLKDTPRWKRERVAAARAQDAAAAIVAAHVNKVRASIE